MYIINLFNKDIDSLHYKYIHDIYKYINIKYINIMNI